MHPERCIFFRLSRLMENLIALQSIDAKLKDINDLLGDLPSKVEDLNKQEYAMKSSLNNNKVG